LIFSIPIALVLLLQHHIQHFQILNKVKIKNKSNSSVLEYTLVSESEADLRAGKISVNTPIAKGLMGKKVGDIVNVRVPSGAVEYEIVNISR
jgi:transcription elongation factor GreA